MNAWKPVSDSLGEHILYVTALLADHPRRIDRHLDYFGERPRPTAECAVPEHTGAAGTMTAHD